MFSLLMFDSVRIQGNILTIFFSFCFSSKQKMGWQRNEDVSVGLCVQAGIHGDLPSTIGEDMKKLSVSILSADFGRLAEQIAEAEAGGADWVHVDVMDGHFVPNITIGPDVVRALRKVTGLPLDVHLMIEKPERYLEAFAAAGADWLGVHVETCPHVHRTVQRIRELGIRPAVVLNPATPLVVLEEILSEVDMVLLMTVNPGFGGQKFIPGSLDKIRRCRRMIDRLQPGALLQVDGGVNLQSIGALTASGVDVFVAGSAVFNDNSCAENIQALKSRM
jgi:ribulose-phosphate 3-epimerase